MILLCIFLLKNFVSSKKSSTFAPAFGKKQVIFHSTFIRIPYREFVSEVIGAVVQLVRIPACHAVGREFESRPHRYKDERYNAGIVLLFFRPDGGIGRRAGLKHQWSNPCRFDPGSGYNLKTLKVRRET